MSMRTSIAYGYGISEECINSIKNDMLANFAKKHLPPNYWENNINDMTTEDILDAIDCFEDQQSCTESPYAVISTVITKETGIDFALEDTEYGKAIMMYQGLPWHFDQKTKDLTEDKLKEILQPYLTELGLNVKDLGEVSVERLS